MDFKELTTALDKNPWSQHPILAFDPGHTTGWAFFEEGELKFAGEIDTTSIEACGEHAVKLFALYRPVVVVMEDYRVYKWRAKHHVGSELLTSQVLGALQLLAIQSASTQNIAVHIIKQPAQVAKGFCTDKKLKEWGYWQSGERHARDAIRHGCYYILFGATRKKDRDGSSVG